MKRGDLEGKTRISLMEDEALRRVDKDRDRCRCMTRGLDDASTA